jgi:NADH-quinone oxidoreductase subunit C
MRRSALNLKGKTAVFAAMAENCRDPGAGELATDAKFDRNELTITVARENIVAACEAVKAPATTSSRM